MPKMKYVNIPCVNKPISRILYGTAIGPMMMGQDANDLLDSIYAAGVTAFDTARAYMLSERSLGKWIDERGIRDKVVILSKCGHPSPTGEKRINKEEIRKDFDESCNYLRTDYIDIYILHRDDIEIPVGTVIEIFNELHNASKIGAFGCSNWTHRRIAEANEYAYKHSLIPFTVSSPHFGLANQVVDPWGGGCITISGSANAEARDWYSANQMPVIAYSGLARGLFSGKVKGDEPERAKEILDEVAMKGYGHPENFERLRRVERLAKEKGYTVPQIAMAWIFKQRLNSLAVVSTIKASRMEENIAALHIELSAEEVLYLDLIQDCI